MPMPITFTFVEVPLLCMAAPRTVNLSSASPAGVQRAAETPESSPSPSSMRKTSDLARLVPDSSVHPGSEPATALSVGFTKACGLEHDVE